MLIVGSDRLTASGITGAPDGTIHAVDTEGRVLCRSSRPRFTWPHLGWHAVSRDEDACRLCAQVSVAREAVSLVAAYPRESAALVPWQPTAGLFVPNER